MTGPTDLPQTGLTDLSGVRGVSPTQRERAASLTAMTHSSLPAQGRTAPISSGTQRTLTPRRETRKTESKRINEKQTCGCGSVFCYNSTGAGKTRSVLSILLFLTVRLREKQVVYCQRPILAFCLAQESFNVTVRLNTRCSGVLS